MAWNHKNMGVESLTHGGVAGGVAKAGVAWDEVPGLCEMVPPQSDGQECPSYETQQA